jgi:ribosomal protein S18 acetylase RimI-like enzyme
VVPIDVRLAQSEEDVNVVAPLFDAYRVFYKAPSDPQGALAFLLARWRGRESVIFIAFDDDRPVGFVQLYPIFSSVSMTPLWLLNDLYVHPGTSRSGVGRALMRRAEEHARTTGACGLTLSTATDNKTAQSLYESEDYERDREFYVYNKHLDDEQA